MYHLRELRTQKGLTQAELSKALQVSASSIGMYEQGRREPDNETLGRIANFFHVSTDYLLGRTDEPGGAAGLQKDTPLDSHLVMTSNVLGDSDTDDIQRRYSQLDEAGKAAVKNLISIFENAKKTNQ